ncbi:MAG: M3 family oligoendopeptidase [Roseiflexaceae bacterium]
MLPHWDLSDVFPSLESPAFVTEFSTALDQIGTLAIRFDQLGIGLRDPAPFSDADRAAFDEITTSMGAIRERLTALRAYIYSFVSTDSRNQIAQARMSELNQRGVVLEQLSTRLTAWIGRLDVESLIDASPLAADYAHLLRRTMLEAQHLMSPAEEELAAELGPSAGTAWSRLHADLSSQLIVPILLDGEQRELPMTVIRNLAYDPDRSRRQAGYEAELAAWKRSEVAMAACMNGIKGEVGVLARRRGWESPLAEACFDNAIDQQTLAAMMTAAHESFPDFRRYLRAKARALGVEQLAWYDIFAPLSGDSGQRWEYDRACQFIRRQFATFAPHMASLADQAFAEHWIDAEPRDGKVGGAFCMGVRPGESRILTNYNYAIGGVMTLAHELGHAYHNARLGNQLPLNRTSPMTLAETASIFCETIVRQAALAESSPAERLVILEAALQNACQVVVDITSRYLFEQATFENRQQRALSAAELCEHMLNGQRSTYGDGLDQTLLHPYMWAAKPHYYSSSRSFYNFPYMFGLLFGLGLFAIYQREPDGFVERYDTLLASTGRADAATLAAEVGIDIRTPNFWRASLDTIRADIAAFEALV